MPIFVIKENESGELQITVVKTKADPESSALQGSGMSFIYSPAAYFSPEYRLLSRSLAHSGETRGKDIGGQHQIKMVNVCRAEFSPATDKHLLVSSGFGPCIAVVAKLKDSTGLILYHAAGVTMHTFFDNALKEVGKKLGLESVEVEAFYLFQKDTEKHQGKVPMLAKNIIEKGYANVRIVKVANYTSVIVHDGWVILSMPFGEYDLNQIAEVKKSLEATCPNEVSKGQPYEMIHCDSAWLASQTAVEQERRHQFCTVSQPPRLERQEPSVRQQRPAKRRRGAQGHEPKAQGRSWFAFFCCCRGGEQRSPEVDKDIKPPKKRRV